MSQEDNNKEIPAWKADFPIKQEEATHVSRREFVKCLCMLSGGLAVGNSVIAATHILSPKEGIKGEHFVCLASDVKEGEMRQFYINNNHKVPYILINLGWGKWKAYEQKCTHLSCAVLYDHSVKKIVCPCHQGYFDVEDGSVLQGPPPRPLPPLNVAVKEDKIYVTEEEKA